MFAYIPESRVLFSGDVLGCHYCDGRVFNDLVPVDLVTAQKYYFNVIMSPFKTYMLEAIDKICAVDMVLFCAI